MNPMIDIFEHKGGADTASALRQSALFLPPPSTGTDEKLRHWAPGAWETLRPLAPATEHRALANLDDLRASIERLRVERDNLMGQFHDLIRPIAGPATMPHQPSHMSEARPDATLPRGQAESLSPWERDHLDSPLAGLGLDPREPIAGPVVGEPADLAPPLEILDPVEEFEALVLRVREACRLRELMPATPRRHPLVSGLQWAVASLAVIAVAGSVASARAPLPIGRHEAVRRLVPSPWDGRLLTAWSTLVSAKSAVGPQRADAPLPSRPLAFELTTVKPAWVGAGLLETTVAPPADDLERAHALTDTPDGATENQNP